MPCAATLFRKPAVGAPSRRTRLSWLLVAPLLLLVVAGFLVPIGYTMTRAVDNAEVTGALPRTVAMLERWDGNGLPSEQAFAALVEDLRGADDAQAFGAMTRRLNFELSGARSVMRATRRQLDSLTPPYAESLPTAVPDWDTPQLWLLIKTNSNPFTASFLLRALDLQVTPEGQIEPVPHDRAIFVDLFQRTFWISLWVTVFCVLLAYPAAYYISTLSDRGARYVMLLVLVPFWTSILVRTTAWFILLQREGPMNAALEGLHITDAPLQLIFTRFAVYVAMVHVLLPFQILPLYSVMKRLGPQYLQAAASLGASPWRQFRSVYLPLTMPGVAAGAVMVFMLSVGFYVTPALVGGLQDQMISYYIAFYTNQSINFGMAAALSLLLLVFTGALVAAARRLTPHIGPGPRE
ncbi:ABC transporter permease [Pseudodonghicola xiamenensis]|uniref:Polyamine ABC transporter substrate-binding protein n=1 Tax=Pseudodonghicola xiamenensis TaxID=337702 RepID=A0A8J3H4G9_9RHOB|nr:ABC transporter permease [Pseudodonghicola xiamenensis]GHG85653.1 polyamine ABC transporter substrate-binding protein [Pseudodonghicola xiamenensis]